MTDPADRFLEERLHALARGVGVPVVPAGDDVRRGRRRLFRLRVAMAGATTGTLAVVVGVTGLTAGDPKATEPGQFTHPPTSLPSAPTTSPSSPTTDPSAPATERTDKGGGDAKPGNQPDADPATETTGATDPGRTGGLPGSNDPTGAATGGATIVGTTHGGGSPGHHHGPSTDPTETPGASDSPTTTPSGDPSTDPTGTPTSTPSLPPTGSTKIRVYQVLRYYNDVLAEHLDSARTHLQPYDRTIDVKSTRTANGHLYALGSTYRWEDGGSPSGLDITVASGWDQVDWHCGASYSDWICHAGADDTTEFAEHDGVLQVAVAHASGQIVILTADPGSTVDSSQSDLAQAAADDRLILPGAAPVAPPVIDAAAFAAAGAAQLVGTGESFDQSGLDRSPWVRGVWTSAQGDHGTLAWTVEPIYSRGRFTCLTSYRTCKEVTVDAFGTTVHVALLRQRAGGGWLVQYDGGSYGVRVYCSSPKFPRKRAYAFITQRDWQPDR